MNPLHSVVRIFVNTFGITQPSPENEAKAGRFILLMLFLVFLVIAGAGWLLRSALTR